MATIMTSSTTALSRHAVRAAVREESTVERASTLSARSFANVVKGASALSGCPVPTVQASHRQMPQSTVATTTTPPAAPWPRLPWTSW